MRNAFSSLVALTLALMLTAGCGGLTATHTAPTDDAVVQFQTTVQDAVVYVNGRFVRRISELKAGMALSAGNHLIEVRHDRYHTYYLELTVKKRERRTIPVKLAEILP